MVAGDFPLFIMGIAALYTVIVATATRFAKDHASAAFLAFQIIGHYTAILIVAVSGFNHLAKDGLSIIWNILLITLSAALVFGPSVIISIILGRMLMVSVDDISARTWKRIRKCSQASAGLQG